MGFLKRFVMSIGELTRFQRSAESGFIEAHLFRELRQLVEIADVSVLLEKGMEDPLVVFVVFSNVLRKLVTLVCQARVWLPDFARNLSVGVVIAPLADSGPPAASRVPAAKPVFSRFLLEWSSVTTFFLRIVSYLALMQFWFRYSTLAASNVMTQSRRLLAPVHHQ